MSIAVDDLETTLDECRRVRSSETPLQLDPDTGAWTVFRYDDVANLLSNHEIFSNTPPGAPYASQYAMLFTDPPRHRELRSLVSKAFTPRAIAKLEGRLGELTDELLQARLPAGEMNVVPDIADPLPVAMIAEMLGVDADTRHEFKRWSHSFTVTALSQAHGQEGLDDHLAILSDMFEYFEGIIADRRKNPQDDLITALVQAEEHGKHLSAEELKATCAQLLAAGNETTTNLIGNAVVCLSRRPDVLHQLREDPGLIPGFIEEVLRYMSPVQYVPRYTKERVVLHGQVIEAGRPVFVHLGSANRDPDHFQSPDEFLITRDPNRHLGFGFAAHFCLGASLARLETKVAIERMLLALPGEWNIPLSLNRLPEEPFFFGFTSLPLSWKLA